MDPIQCPLCGCEHFYVKDPEDEYEIHEFTCRDGKIVFEGEKEEDAPCLEDESHIWCDRCAWNGPLNTSKKR